MNKIPIPKEYQLFGHTIEVIQDSDLVEKTDAVGEYDPKNFTIALQSKTGSFAKRPDAHFEHNFYHEKVHSILGVMGEEDLDTNDQFVDIFAALLHQIDKTAKY